MTQQSKGEWVELMGNCSTKIICQQTSLYFGRDHTNSHFHLGHQFAQLVGFTFASSQANSGLPRFYFGRWGTSVPTTGKLNSGGSALSARSISSSLPASYWVLIAKVQHTHTLRAIKYVILHTYVYIIIGPTSHQQKQLRGVIPSLLTKQHPFMISRTC